MMTPDDFRQARIDVGRAVLGRALTYGEMAHLCGLKPASGDRTVRGIELNRDQPTGPYISNVEWLMRVLDREASWEARNWFAGAIRDRLATCPAKDKLVAPDHVRWKRGF